MKITQYNKDECIEYLRARIFLLLMNEGRNLDVDENEHASALWEVVGSMTDEEAIQAIKIFEATQ